MFKRIIKLLTPKPKEPCPPHVFKKWEQGGHGYQVQYCKKCNFAQTRQITSVREDGSRNGY